MKDLPVSHLPSAIQEYVTQQWQRLLENLTDIQLTGQQLIQLANVIAGSDFVVKQMIAKPDLLQQLITSQVFERPYEESEYAEKISHLLADIEDEKSLEVNLRRFRQQEMVRLIWRDLNRLSSTQQTIAELSTFADACIDESLKKLYHWLTLRFGVPYSRAQQGCEPQQQHMVVLGMGKLGAKELNLSSDIDLMFCYPENGETQGQKKSIDNQDFFIRLGKKLIQALDAPTAEGFVFRVDMRLRPFGSVSPLACSFVAMENYYQQHGREWERYAMIKARVVAGHSKVAEQLMLDLKPFVYRKYIDYSAFESLREMKQMINSEVRRKGLTNNVKLGAGGIREIEFVAQAFQLIRGGRDSRLQQRALLKILPLLQDTVGMPQKVIDELTQGYLFLRDTEHAIQAIADQQSQELPSDEKGLLRIACNLGFSEVSSFLACLNKHRENVSHHFAQILAPTEEEQASESTDNDWLLLWELTLTDEEGDQLCAEKGFKEPSVARKLITDMAGSKAVRLLQPISSDRLKLVMPKLFREISEADDNTVTLQRVLKLVSAILRRSAYLVLLAENPYALQQLVKLCSASGWFSDVLAKQPVLLDELITPQTLYAPPDKLELDLELNRQMLRIPEDDEEQQMDALRYFKHAHLLRVAASEVTGVLPLMKVSDYLTWLAESILHRVLDMAWHTLVSKHGTPCDANAVELGRNFIVIAYGKMGGIELSYGSDLDLVFLHGADSNASTNGNKPITNAVFFTRLGQKVIHILNTFTTTGQLYEIDMRLRPAGNSGMLVSTLKAFEEYQLKNAWTWEHQALVRARVISGSDKLAEQFQAVRAKVLSQVRETQTLQTDVSQMREKMRDHLGTREGQKEQQFNLKQDRGGIVDIEFMVQYFCLRYGHQYPEIFTFTDNMRILDALEQVKLLKVEQAEQLREAYKAFRAVGHRKALQEQSSTIEADQLNGYRESVAELWDELIVR